MKCPRCVQVIHRGAENCPHCGFTCGDADAVHGGGVIEIGRLDDAAGLLRRAERRRVESALDGFERRFPQLFFAIHTCRQGEAGDLRQFGFWLLNRARFVGLGDDVGNEGGILLTLDPEAREAGLTWGYRLDPVLDDHESFLCLSRAHAYWVEGRFAAGMLRVIEQMSRVLVKRSRQARRQPERFGTPAGKGERQ